MSRISGLSSLYISCEVLLENTFYMWDCQVLTTYVAYAIALVDHMYFAPNIRIRCSAIESTSSVKPCKSLFPSLNCFVFRSSFLVSAFISAFRSSILQCKVLTIFPWSLVLSLLWVIFLLFFLVSLLHMQFLYCSSSTFIIANIMSLLVNLTHRYITERSKKSH